jgi:hypothetical protein
MKKQLIILAISLLGLDTFGQVPNYIPTNGLVGWFPFNGNANDASGSNNNLTTNATLPSLTYDRFGNCNSAYHFEPGSNLFKSTPITNGQNFTWSFWMKKYNTDIESGGIAETNNTSTSGGGFSCTYNIPQFICQGIAVNVTNSSTTISTGIWNHYVVTKSGSTFSIYINGVLNSQGNSSYLPYMNTTYFKMGCVNTAISDFDDVALWNLVLNQTEISALYNASPSSNNSEINAGADISICNGETVLLQGTNGSNFQWNNNVIDNSPFSPTNSSAYVLTGLTTNGCPDSDTIFVSVLETSSSTLTETALDSYTLNGQTYTQSGIYTQVIPNAAGCDSTITLNLTLNFSGLNELESTLTVAPNPTMDIVYITSTETIYDVYVLFDPQGRKVLSSKLNGTTTQLDLSQLARGNYLLQIGEKKTPIKLIKD